MRGKHTRQFRRLNVAIRYGVILAVSGSIAAGVVLAAGRPRLAGMAPLARAEPTPALALARLRTGDERVAAGICTSPSAAGHALAARMSRGILAALLHEVAAGHGVLSASQPSCGG